MANAIVGILSTKIDENHIFTQYAIFGKSELSYNCKIFNDSIKLISGSFNRDDVLLLITDAAPCMIKAGLEIKILYSKLIHVTCIAHALHRAAEFVRGRFQNIDCWVSNLKKIFMKAPSRVEIF